MVQRDYIQTVRQLFQEIPEERRHMKLRRRASGEIVAVTCSLLDARHVKEAQALNAAVAATVENPETFVADNSIEKNLTGEGWGLGLWYHGELVAMLIYSTIEEDWKKLVQSTQLRDLPASKGVIRDIAAVKPDFRGNNLQRRLLQLSRACMPPWVEHVISTVSPHNPASLSNALAAGCHVVDWGHFYDDRSRFLTYLNIKEVALEPANYHLAMMIPLDQAATHRRLLLQGFRGTSVERWGRLAALCYILPAGAKKDTTQEEKS